VSSDLAKVLSAADVKEKLLGLGIESVGSTPEQFMALLKSEIARWTPVIQKAGLKIE